MEQSLRSRLNPGAPCFVPLNSVNRGSEDERCLYLTFSKGFPVSSSEILAFFREMCEKIGGSRQNPKAVETVYVHRGEGGAALFGKIVFCNPYLPGFFLGAQREMKFVVNGKTLWCKKFVRRSDRSYNPFGGAGVGGPQLEVSFGGAGVGGPQLEVSFGGAGVGNIGGSQFVPPLGPGLIGGPGGTMGHFMSPIDGRVIGQVGPPPPQGLIAPGGVVFSIGHEGHYYQGMGIGVQGGSYAGVAAATDPVQEGYFQAMGGSYGSLPFGAFGISYAGGSSGGFLNGQGRRRSMG